MNYSNNLKKIIKKKDAVIGLIGMGYVGLPLSILISDKGYKLNCFDKNFKRVKLLKSGRSYFNNIKNKELKSFKKNTQIFTGLKNISNCDIIILCLPTPLKSNKKPDLSDIKVIIQKIKNKLKKGQLLILESTSYPGTTTEEIYDKLKFDFDIGKNFFIAFSSERINPGMKMKIQNIPKVISGHTKKCLELTRFFYSRLFSKLILAKSTEIAEFSKLLENIYRSVNIGFINEMKFIADKFGLDIFEIIALSNTKPFGFKRFDPGPGIGGHCIPIDPQYLYWKSRSKGLVPKFIKLSAEINLEVIPFIYKKIIKRMQEVNKMRKNFKIIILGIAYKKNVDDDRESAPIKLVEFLINKNFKKVEYSDPYIPKYRFNKRINKTSNKINKKTLTKFDLVIIGTDHDKFDFKNIEKNSSYIIDCRGRLKLGKKVIRG